MAPSNNKWKLEAIVDLTFNIFFCIPHSKENSTHIILELIKCSDQFSNTKVSSIPVKGVNLAT